MFEILIFASHFTPFEKQKNNEVVFAQWMSFVLRILSSKQKKNMMVQNFESVFVVCLFYQVQVEN